jgi:spermidine synthase
MNKKATSMVTLNSQSIASFLRMNKESYDLIIMDLPDPKTLELRMFYKPQYIKMISQHLVDSGILVTQLGNTYENPEDCYEYPELLSNQGIGAVLYHAQIPTIGQWGWLIGSRSHSSLALRKSLFTVKQTLPSIWWNPEAMKMMLSMGKSEYFMGKKRSLN